jgi:putative ABC transport system substrate-binding protein
MGSARRHTSAEYYGAKVAELPIQLPTKYQLVINLKATRIAGLAIPPTLLVQTDEVIE